MVIYFTDVQFSVAAFEDLLNVTWNVDSVYPICLLQYPKKCTSLGKPPPQKSKVSFEDMLICLNATNHLIYGLEKKRMNDLSAKI